MILPTHADVRSAAARIAPHVRRTPVLTHPLLDEAAGARVFIKPECLQRTGSFKLRGATNAALLLSEAQRAAGIVTHSSGNHGQAVACAAAMLGAPALIAMPSDAPAIKVESTRRWGAEITFFDRATTDRETLAARLAAERGGVVVPPFDHADVIAGQGSVALELLEDAPEPLDTLAVCTGGGGLVAGCALAAEGVRVWGVEPEGWDDTARSFASGERVRNDGAGSTFCDALLSMRPGEITFAINRARLAGVVVVSEAEVRAAMRFAFLHLKLVVEPGGAVALAAVLARRVTGRAIGVVISGGNVDPAAFARVLQEA
jgi:threonine dehydratase